ncbi:ABC transporter G family member 1-like isoform X4 [Ziziphus jujuba]|uniref:ABC transporter G family member 1-like isoform X4 n=1 Tax=Ziziphus jujuba TaxID=326968 RepID=A0ABM4AHA7_ZIZJJ|nr:ABC transporter G family member 1-like isoform X4 [Ziziphus jujuba]
MANNLEITAALEMERVNYNDNNNNNNNNHDKVVEEGVCLTWEDLWVTVSKGRSSSKAILQGLTGHAKPGELMAIMGPSGCGKSTLLDALAGRLSSKTRQSGDILINGRKETLAYGTLAYVTQDDTLITTLTVSEAVYYSAQLQLPDSMSKSKKKGRAEMTIREMGLQDAMNTRIGGWGCKGLSGGQKRRVSICIEILTHPKLLFLDEPTSGLDSAASYHVMSGIASLDQRDGSRRTIIASIHQPSSEVFQLFSSLCLLSSGKTVYFGPAARANEFFTLCGFPCPTLQNPSDHFLKTINKDFERDIEQGSGGAISTEEVINTLIKSYKASETYQQVRREIAEISKKARGSLIMFIVSFLTFMAIGGFPSFVEDMKVFERERLNGHYGAAAFMMGNTFSAVPYLLIISVIPGSLAYFLPGLQEGTEHFFYFFCVIFACMMLVESLMMIIASLVPNYLMGIMAGAGVQGLMILGGGLFRLPGDLPKQFWRYPLHYIAFHRYAYQGMFKNEFEGLTFPNNQVEGRPTISGEEILRNTWQVNMGHSKWVDLGTLLGMIAFYRILFLVIIKTSEKLKTVNLGKFMAISPKQSIQVTENPIVTPMHGDQINNHQYKIIYIK